MRAAGKVILFAWVLLPHTGCARDRALRGETARPAETMQGRVSGENLPSPSGRGEPGDRPGTLIRESRPVALHVPLPEYPRQALEEQVDCEVRLLYHVEKDGSATAARFQWDSSPPDRYLQAFEMAVLEAVAEWKFEPAIRYVTTRMPDGSVDTDTEAVTRSKWIRIRFQVVDGRGMAD